MIIVCGSCVPPLVYDSQGQNYDRFTNRASIFWKKRKIFKIYPDLVN